MIQKRFIPLLIFLFSFSLEGFAQQQDYPTITDNGRQYYIYTVGPDEGLYMISNKFHVTQTEIFNNNPDIINGLKAGQKLKIPVVQPQPADQEAVAAMPSATSQQNGNSAATPVRTQNYPVISENGVQYYLYTVEPKEGLYGVSHKFNVTQIDILNCNPEAAKGLKIGQKLKIPVAQQQFSQPQPPLQPTVIKHVVKKKETLFSLSRQYGTSVDDIIALNPSSAKKIRIGDTLLIPEKKPFNSIESKHIDIQSNTSEPSSVQTQQTPSEYNGANAANYVNHTVVAGETFYSLSRLFKVNVNAIMAANPDVKMLKTGAIVKIPVQPAQTGSKIENGAQQPVLPEKPEQAAIKVAMLLPFSLDGATEDPTIDKFIEFYRGSLLALQYLKSKGISVDLYTYDTEKTVEKIEQLLNNEPQLSQVDLIIGPAYSIQINAVANFALMHKIHTVIPFSSKIDGIDNNPYLFQFNPSAQIQAQEASALFARYFKNDNIIIAKIAGSSNSDNSSIFIQTLTETLKKQKINYNTAELSGGSVNELKPFFSYVKNNIIVFANDNGEEVAPYIAAMNTLNTLNPEFKNISLYGFSSWNPTAIKKNNPVYFTSLFYAHDQSILMNYDAYYSQWFHSQPTNENGIRFDLIGYDVMTYFINAIHEKGAASFAKKLPASTSDNIQSQYKFKKAGATGGYVNTELYLLRNTSGTVITLAGE